MRQERNDKISKSIEDDINAAARTHLNSHVTTEEVILTLDKNCEYCQIMLKNERIWYLSLF
jgi:hypothetical protein